VPGRRRQIGQQLPDAGGGTGLVALHQWQTPLRSSRGDRPDRRHRSPRRGPRGTTPGPVRKHRRVLGHDDQVGERGRVGAAARPTPRRRSRSAGRLRSCGDRLAEDPPVARERGRASCIRPRPTRRTRPPASGPLGDPQHSHDGVRHGVRRASPPRKRPILGVSTRSAGRPRAGGADDAIATHGSDHRAARTARPSAAHGSCRGHTRASRRSSGVRRGPAAGTTVALIAARPGTPARRCGRRTRTSSRSPAADGRGGDQRPRLAGT